MGRSNESANGDARDPGPGALPLFFSPVRSTCHAVNPVAPQCNFFSPPLQWATCGVSLAGCKVINSHKNRRTEFIPFGASPLPAESHQPPARSSCALRDSTGNASASEEKTNSRASWCRILAGG